MGLRPEAAREAAAVKRLARRLGVPHRTLAWRGTKPKTGLQEAARLARYRLAGAGRRASRLRTRSDRAHARRPGGNGSVPPRPRQRPDRACGHGVRIAASAGRQGTIFLVRPLLARRQGAARRDADGGTHRSQRRPEQPRSALYPRAAARADAGARARRPRRALPGAARRADAARRSHDRIRGRRGARGAGAGPVAAARSDHVRRGAVSRLCPPRSALRLLGRAIAHTGDEGPVELGKLESLYEALRQSRSRLRRTLAGASITLGSDRLVTSNALPPGAADPAACAGAPRRAYEAARAALRNSRIISGNLPSWPVPSPGLLLAGPTRTPTLQTYRDVKPPRFAGTNASRGLRGLPDQGHEMNANLRNFALWVIIVLLLLALFTLFQNPGQHTTSQDISLLAAAEARSIRAACATSSSRARRSTAPSPTAAASRPMRRATRPWCSASTTRASRSPRVRRPTTCPGSCRC